MLFSRNDNNNGPSRFSSLFCTLGINYNENSGEYFDDWEKIEEKLPSFISFSKNYLDKIIKD